MRSLLIGVLLSCWLSSSARAYDRNLQPQETIALTASTTSSSAQFTGAQSVATQDVLVTNNGSVLAFVACGTDPATKAVIPGDANSTPVFAGSAIMLNKGPATYCAAITASGSAPVYFTSGIGN